MHVYTVISEIFVVKKCSYSSKITKIKHTKYFQRTYYVIERELNYRRVRKFFNTNILHTNIFNTKIFQTTVCTALVAYILLCPLFHRHIPAITLSIAYSKFFAETCAPFSLAACRAASLTMLAMSAPAKWGTNHALDGFDWFWSLSANLPLCPGVSAARREEYCSTVFSSTNFFKYTSKMAFLSSKVGKLIAICRSNRPGLSNAWSSTSTLLVEASMTTPSSGLIPAINTFHIWQAISILFLKWLLASHLNSLSSVLSHLYFPSFFSTTHYCFLSLYMYLPPFHSRNLKWILHWACLNVCNCVSFPFSTIHFYQKLVQSALLLPVSFKSSTKEDRHDRKDDVLSFLDLFCLAHLDLRDFPTASISSMYTMQGACERACSNRLRTRAEPTPTCSMQTRTKWMTLEMD